MFNHINNNKQNISLWIKSHPFLSYRCNYSLPFILEINKDVTVLISRNRESLQDETRYFKIFTNYKIIWKTM
jgi:hypothetical protein